MSYIEDNICEAIELIVDKSVKEAGFDRTIQATVKSCVDQSIGKYKIKYQDSSFYAYASSPDVVYGDNTLVYILVPQNDMTKDKTILGTVDKLGVDYINPSDKDSGYEIIGVNGISQNSPYSLSSYYKPDEGKTYREFILYDDEHNTLSVDNDALKEYMEEATSLICGATFKTSLAAEQQSKGNYGIMFTVEYHNEVDETATYTKNYLVDVDNMVGNPYQLNLGKRQFGIYKAPGTSFNRIVKISVFVENFPQQKNDDEIINNKLYDIEINNIEFAASAELSEAELKGCSLSLLTPNGAIFTENDADTATLPITAQVKIKGRVADPTVQKIPFYWFIEDLTINNKSQLYNKYGGKGWRCLNDFNIIDEETGQVEWIDKGSKFNLSILQAAAKENKIKCVIIYNGNTYNKTVTIKNKKGTITVSIESDSGTEFYYGVGNPTLTCKVNDKVDTDSGYTYSWAVEDEYGNLTQLEIEGPVIKNIQVQTIVDFVIYKCAVISDAGNIKGTASIKISNLLETKNVYNLIINNGSQIFNYDENGVSPASKAQENPIVINTLTFTVYDNQGREISSDVIKHGEIRWKVPNKNTMLTEVSADRGTEEVDATQEYRYFNQALELSYNILNKYYYNYKNNDIELNIKYKDMSLVAKTNLVFTKQGESGTNGTSFICRIVPNTNAATPQYPVLNMTQKSEDKYTSGYFNFGAEQFLITTSASTRAPFKVEVYKDGEQVYSDTKTATDNTVLVTWEILKNQYKTNISDASDLTIDKNNGTISYTGQAHDEQICGANILKCTVYYNRDNDKQTLIATLPIIISYVENSDYRIYLKDYSGFSYVQYTSDGAFPKYDNTNPFEIEVYNNSALVESDNYEWNKGGRYYSFADGAYLDSNDLINLSSDVYTSKLNKNQRNFKPIANYHGICVNNTVICKCGNYGTIYIPIHFYLNRYGLSQLNDWDGNSISIDEDGGFILSPQMGAGKKNDKNQFTGVLMGQVQESNKTQSETGLFGYHDGARSFTLDAEDGHAIFGQGQGSLAIDPSAGKALLYSGDYWKNYTEKGLPQNYTESNKSGNGFLIDLSSARMESGSGGFTLDGSNGYVTIEHGGTIGGWSVGDNELSSRDRKIGLHSWDSQNDTDSTWAIWSGNGNFVVNYGGHLTATTATIGSGTNKIVIGKSSETDTHSALYSGSHDKLESSNTGFYLGTDGLSIGSNFSVTSAGDLTAKSGTIAGWTIKSNNLNSGKTGYGPGNGSGIYLGTEGIGLGDNFYVSSVGELTAKYGHIGGWTISSESLFANGMSLNPSSGITLGSTFSVNSNGYLTSTSGTIGGWTIGTSSLSAGSLSLYSDGSMSGPGWSITAGGYATFNNVNITGGSIDVGGSTFSSDGSSLASGTTYKGSNLGNYIRNEAGKVVGEFDDLFANDSFTLGGRSVEWSTAIASITFESFNTRTGAYSFVLGLKAVLGVKGVTSARSSGTAKISTT